MTSAAPGQIDAPVEPPFAVTSGAAEEACTHIGDRLGSYRAPDADGPASQASPGTHARPLARGYAESHERPP